METRFVPGDPANTVIPAGEHAFLCEHAEARKHRVMHLSSPVPFQHPRLGPSLANWFMICDSCLVKPGDILDQATGTATIIEELELVRLAPN